MTKKRTNPPESPGARLRRDVLETFELNAAESALLDQASEIVDLLARVDAELADAPLVVQGSTGQEVPHPLIERRRQLSETLTRIVEGMRLPAADEVEGPSRVSQLAARAGRARWDRAKARGDVG